MIHFNVIWYIQQDLPSKLFKTHEDLAELMMPFGELAEPVNELNPVILMGPHGSKKFGICEFTTAEAAASAIQHLNGKPVSPDGTRVFTVEPYVEHPEHKRVFTLRN